MIELIKAMKLEEIADVGREIVEGGKDTDPDFDHNNNSKQIDTQRHKKIRLKSTLPRNNKFQVAKVKAFKKEISKLNK